MANPAARKCLDDGFSLEPIISQGVMVDQFCVNKRNGNRCKVWEYFRGECSLTKKKKTHGQAGTNAPPGGISE